MSNEREQLLQILAKHGFTKQVRPNGGGGHSTSPHAMPTPAEVPAAVETSAPDERQSQPSPPKPDLAAEGAAILEALTRLIGRFVSTSKSAIVVLSVWILHTWCMEAADATPYISVSSAERRAGKTRLLELLELVVCRPWFTARVTAAVLIRKTDAQKNTLLLDESDMAFNDKEEYSQALKGVLNNGYRRGGKTSCCVGKGSDISFKDFDCFSAKAIAGIDKLPPTIADRAIPIRMLRKTKDETVARFRRRRVEVEAAPLRKRIEIWAKTSMKALAELEPELPDTLTDRQQDVAEPLLGICEIIGHGWPERIRTALQELCSDPGADDSSSSLRVRLLTDIAAIMFAKKTDKIFSGDLCEYLAQIESSPWGDYFGKKLAQHGLAKLLKPFNIEPRNVRIGDRTAKGYRLDEKFADAFKRFLPDGIPQSAIDALPTCLYSEVTDQEPIVTNDVTGKNERNVQ